MRLKISPYVIYELDRPIHPNITNFCFPVGDNVTGKRLWYPFACLLLALV